MSADASLADRRIGIPESRQLDLFADMLERRGARVIRCPLVAIHDTPDRQRVADWIETVTADGLDEMIWLTGEGVRRIEGFLGNALPSSRQAFWARQAAARSITRGPKPVRELKPLGIDTVLPATRPTTDGVIDALHALDLAGHRVGVQLYGTDPNTPLMTALAQAGAQALPVAPYVYADAADETRVGELIAEIARGGLDAVAFTSSPQVKRLFQVARRLDRVEDLRAGLDGLCLAAVGPLVADTLSEHGLRPDLVPEHHYFLKPLVRALSAHFGSTPA